MRSMLIAGVIALQAGPAPAQDTITPQESSPEGDRRLRPSLILGSDAEGEIGLEDLYPLSRMTQSSINGASTSVTGTSPAQSPASAMVYGFILNRQLYEITARDYPPSGVAIGQGWNSFLNRPSANICIEGVVATMPGTQVSSQIAVVEDQSSYFKAISGSVGGSYGPFSGSASYSKSKHFSRYDANVVMSAIVDTGGEFIRPSEATSIRLSDIALDLIASERGLERFIQACGDSYVTSYRTGGRMSSLLTITNTTQAEKEAIAAQAKGGYGAFKAQGNFSQTVETASQASRLQVSYEQVGGVISGLPTTVEEHLAKFAQFSVDENFNPRPYVFHTLNYRSLPNWPSNLDNRVSPVDQEYFVLSYYNFSDLAADYDRAIKTPGTYLTFLSGGTTRVSNLRDEALRYARDLDLALGNCVQKHDCSLESLRSWDVGNPTVLMISTDPEPTSMNVSGIAEASGSESGASAEPGANELHVSWGPISGFVRLDAVDLNSAAKPAPATTEPAAQPDGEVILHNLVASYYRLLAALPLLIKDNTTGFMAPPGAADGTPPPDREVVEAFKKWLVENRLRPATQSYCMSSANHPLCLSDREMDYVVSLLDIEAGPLRPVPEPVINAPDPGPVKTKPVPVPIDRFNCGPPGRGIPC